MKSIIITLGFLAYGLSGYSQQVINYSYDKEGRLKSEHFESVYKLDFTYDIEGNLISKALTNYSGISAIDETLQTGNVRLFPNPAEDYVMIESGVKDVIQKIYLFDISGRELKQVRVQESSVRLDITEHKRGMYILKVETDKDTFVFKLIRK
ncbi:MAG: T9SS type A sorting domain-containing protein [Bacteroidales bacterium]